MKINNDTYALYLRDNNIIYEQRVRGMYVDSHFDNVKGYALLDEGKILGVHIDAIYELVSIYLENEKRIEEYVEDLVKNYSKKQINLYEEEISLYNRNIELMKDFLSN